MKPSPRSARWLVGALSIAACSTVLDIEDLETGAKPGSVTGGGAGRVGVAEGGMSNPAGGRASASGGRPTPPSGAGIGGDAGGTSSPVSNGGASTSGGSNSAGAHALDAGAGGETLGEGEGGQGGEGAAGDGSRTVTGKVIDFWGHPLPNVPVGIGDATAATDAAGKFVIPDVTPPYDVSLRIENTRLRYGWVYLGLNRLDPTLQVYVGLEDRSASITFHADNAEFDSEDTVSFALGTPDGSYASTIGSTGLNPSPSWRGPATTNATVHGLWWVRAPDALAPGPELYQAYASQTATFTDGVSAEVRLDLSQSPVPDRLVQGTVTRSLSDGANNYLFVRFPSNGAISLADDTAEGSAYSYTVPDIPNSEVLVAASQGSALYGPYGIAHGVATGPTLNLTPPQPVTIIGPAGGATDVGPETPFEWTAQPGIKVLHLENNDFYRGLFVVTTGTKVTMPAVVGGSTLDASTSHVWKVEVHGTAETMDEATAPEGFLDSFSDTGDTPKGPRRGGGSYSFSQRLGLTTAP